MANTGRNIDEEEEYLKLQKQINDSVKDQVTSFKELGSYTKDILSNYADMQKISVKIKKTEKEIADLLAQGTEEAKSRAAILQQEVEVLKKEYDQIKSINKEMRSLKNLSKATFQSILGYVKDAATGYLDFDQKSRDLSASLGLNNDRMYTMRQNIIQAGVNMAHYGVSVEDALQAQTAYSEELGRSVLLSEDALTNMSKIGKATGLGMAGMAGLTSQMEQFGLGAESASNFIYDMYAETSAMGLNAGKVIKKFESNLGLLNKLNFKAGVAGLKQMAKFSEKYKLDMQSVAGVADKVFRPEGAIEAAAQLQVLGGSLAALGDPFTLMYKARNAPEELTKSIAKAAAASAKFNDKTGEFEVNAYEMDRMKEAAQALGLSYDEMVKSAKETAKIQKFEGLLSGKGLKAEDKEAIAMMSQMKDGKAMIQVGMTKDGKADLRELSSLSSGQLEQVLADKKNVEQAAEQATGVKQKWENLLNEFIIALYPMLESLQKDLLPIVNTLAQWGKSFALTLKDWMTALANSPIAMFFLKYGLIIGAIGKVLGPLFSIAGWFLKGIWLSKGFESGVEKGGFFKKIGSFFKNLNPFGKGGGAVPSGGVTPGTTGGAPAGTNPQQVAGNTNPASMIKAAASILILSAALFVFAKALQEFDKLKNGWETLGIAAGGMLILAGGLWAISKLPSQNIIQGALAIGILGVSMIPFAYAMSLMSNVNFESLVSAAGGLIIFTAAAFGLGALLMGGGAVIFGAGILGFLALGGAMMVLGLGLSVVVGPLGQFMATIGDGTALLNAGLGFLSLSAGIGVLAGSLIALGAASILAIPGLIILNSVTSMLTSTATALQSAGGGGGLTATINAINSVDTEKLNALKDLSMWMALVGASPTIKFDESLSIDGNIQISGQAGGKTNTDWINDTMFIAALKDKIMKSADNERKAPGRNNN